jgi:hypothetical protein
MLICDTCTQLLHIIMHTYYEPALYILLFRHNLNPIHANHINQVPSSTGKVTRFESLPSVLLGRCEKLV